MNAKNLGEKYVKTLQVRLNQEQVDFVNQISDILGITPSEYVRMVINVYMSSYGGGLKNENEQTNSDNIL